MALEISFAVDPDKDIWDKGGECFVVSNAKKKRVEVNWKKLADSEKERFQQAKQKELDAWIKNKVVEMVSKKGVAKHRIMRMRWILSYKSGADDVDKAGQAKTKARLVLLGFEDPDIDVLKTDSPTLSRVARQLVLAIAANQKWKLKAGDVATAFLQGEEETRLIYGEPPADVRDMLKMSEHQVLKLLKAGYGLINAPIKWHKRFVEKAKECGWVQHHLDPCLFMCYDDEDQLCGLMGVHVDDALVGGSGRHYDKCFDQLTKALEWSRWKEWSFEFCGIHIEQDADLNITVDQAKYVAGLHPITVSRERGKQEGAKLTSSEETQLRALLGGLQWHATSVASYLQCGVSMLQGEVKQATVKTLIQANKLLRQAKAYGNIKMRFTKLGELQDLVIGVFSDAAWANRPDEGSQGAYLVFVSPPSVLTGSEVNFS